jgi:hypothetical protein
LKSIKTDNSVINISSLNKGIYFLKILQDNKIETLKFEKL